jgi:hypothetical protein
MFVRSPAPRGVRTYACGMLARPNVSLLVAAVANPTINDLASRIQELTREKHRLYHSIHTRQQLLFG